MNNLEWPYQRVFCGVCGAVLEPDEKEICKPFHRLNSPELREEIRKTKERIRAYDAEQRALRPAQVHTSTP